MIRKLTKKDIPDGSLALFCTDIHIGIEYTEVLKLMVECAEREGVTHIFPGGDIFDFHVFSSHEKDMERILAAGTVEEEIASGRWLIDWFTSRPCTFIPGNHEGRLDRFVAKYAPALYGTDAVSLRAVAKIPDAIDLLPWEEGRSEIRIGNLALVHGDGEFKRGDGGVNPAARLLQMAPDRSTACGHVHRITQARRTSRDENGIRRTRGAFTMGHLSREEKHHGYAGKNPNWQNGFGLIRVFWDGEKARFTMYQIEVLFDRKGRPFFEFNGHIYR